MFLLLRCSYMASLSDMFRPSHGSSSGWSLFVYKASHTISNALALLIVCKQKVINLKMAQGRAETCRWEKPCKNILVIKTLNNCVWLYFTYIFCDSIQHNRDVTPESYSETSSLWSITMVHFEWTWWNKVLMKICCRHKYLTWCGKNINPRISGNE